MPSWRWPLLLLAAAPLVAQVNTGNVYGNVIDEQGMPIPGGTATLIGPSQPTTTSVDAQGLFRFLKVPPGKYSVTVTMPGFTTVTRENVSVSVGKNTQVDVQLKLSTVQETVTVTSATPLIDTRKVETGQNFSHEELTEIPTSRDVWSLIQQVPGVQIDTVNVAGNQSGVAGGPDFITKGSGNVVYQVDGATMTDNTYGNRVRPPERRHEHVLRLRDVPGRRGRDGRIARRAADLRRDDQRRHQARHQRDQGLGALPVRLEQLAVEQSRRRKPSIRACRPTTRG